MITIIDVAPLGHRRSTALVSRKDGCGLMDVDIPIWPTSERGERLRAARLAAGLSLRTACDRLSLRPSQLSGLEFGRFTMSDADWRTCLEMLAK